MPAGVAVHRTRIGSFYAVAVRLSTYKLSFLTSELVQSFYFLLCMKPHIALLLFLISSWYDIKTSKKSIDHVSSKGNTDISQPPKVLSLTTLSMRLVFILIVHSIIILLAGDIHTNPGPPNNPCNTSDLSVIHINCRSLRNKIDIISCEIGAYDIVTMSETWLDDDVSDNDISIEGFQKPIRKDLLGQTYPHGGVAIYVKDNLICKERPDLDIPGLEAVWIETKLGQETFLIGSFYRQPSQPVAYWKLVDQSIQNVASTPHRFIILGDFNQNFLDNPSEHLLNIIAFNNLQQLINTPTRYTETTATCLDVILAQSVDRITDSGVLPPICSDHSVPFVKLNTNTPKGTSFKRKIYCYSKLDQQKLNDELKTLNLMETVSSDNIHNAAKAFSEQLLSVASNCMPVKTITVRDRDAEWVTEDIKLLRNRKNQSYRHAKLVDNEDAWRAFRHIRNEYTTAIRKRKSEYDKELDENISSSSNFGTKQWWKLVRSFLSKKGSNNDNIPPLDVDGQILYTNDEKAHALNDFFTKQSTTDNDEDNVPEVPRVRSQIPPLNLTPSDVKTILDDLNQSKAVGPDLVHNKILTACSSVIAEPLAYLFNRSLAEGIFPSIWKTAHVSPIYKKGERNKCNNYRPISLLSCVGKVLEKCVQSHLLTYLSENNLITPSQSGFLPGHSTIYQLLNIYDDLCKCLDQGSAAQAVFFDISKAFDKVWHKGLIKKLEGIGVRGGLLCWFKDYLSDRKQAVVVKGSISEYLCTSAGVPQGSVLGPVLFLIYINDIVSEIESVMKLFADDTSMYLCLDNQNIRAEILNSDLDKISEWALKWKVKFNEEKTELLNISRQQDFQTVPLTFGGTTLTDSATHKHLGVILQNDCKWDSHIKYVIAKCRT